MNTKRAAPRPNTPTSAAVTDTDHIDSHPPKESAVHRDQRVTIAAKTKRVCTAVKTSSLKVRRVVTRVRRRPYFIS
jgi:hypothetical protein